MHGLFSVGTLPTQIIIIGPLHTLFGLFPTFCGLFCGSVYSPRFNFRYCTYILKSQIKQQKLDILQANSSLIVPTYNGK